MTEHSRIDPETLAALMDGTLDNDDRQSTLEALEGSASDREVLADAAAALAHADAAVDSEADPRGSRTEPRRGLAWKVLLPLAASVVAVWALLARSPESQIAKLERDAPRIVEDVGALASTFGADWETAGLSVTRGEGVSAVSNARDYRLGVRLTQLVVAGVAEDGQALEHRAAALSNLLSGIEGGGLAASAVDRWVADPARAARVTDVAEAVTAAASARWLTDLGIAVERARLAMLSASPSTPDHRALAAELMRLESDLPAVATPSVGAAIRAVGTALRSGASREETVRALEAVSRAAGG